jgi:RNA polymerase sigma factor (sigma-70 family)
MVRSLASARVIHLSENDSALAGEARAAALIVDGIERDDAAAKARLYERYASGLMRLVLRKVRDRGWAETIVQETFEIVLEKLAADGLEYPERLAGYMRGVVRHRISAYFRQRDREPIVSDPALVDLVKDVRPLQYEDIDRTQTNAMVHELLESLPVARDRELLVRLYIYDQDRVEIRKALNLSPHQLDVALSRARGRLKKIISNSPIAQDYLPH